MPLELWLAFVAASAVLLVIPGPTILTVISYSLAHGRRANGPLVAAVALGDSTGLAAKEVAPPLAVSGSRWRLFAHTYIVTALNPKGIVFFVAFLPQFISPAVDVAPQLWILAVTFVVMATINATLYALFAASASRLLSSARAQRRFQFAGGSLLSVAGVWALLARRAV